MADERNIIEIILKARDETSAAFASLAAKMGLAEAESKKLAGTNKELEQTFENVRRGAVATEQKFDDLAKSYDSQERSLRKNVDLTKEVADAHVKVEQAASRLAKTMDEESHSYAEQQKAVQDLKKAEDDLTDTLTKQIDGNDKLSAAVKKRAGAQAAAHSATVAQAAKERAIGEEQIKQIQNLGAERDKAARQEQQNLSAVERIRDNIARRNAQRAREELDDIKKQQQAENHAALLRMGMLEKIEKDEATIAAARKRRRQEDLADIQKIEAERAAAAQREEQRTNTLDRLHEQVARRNAQRARDELAAIRQEEAAASAAARTARARSDAEISDIRKSADALRQYEASIKRAAEAKQRLRDQKLTDVEKITVELDQTRALAEAEALKKTIDELFKNAADVKVKLDTADFDAKAGEIEAIKALLGKDVHVNVDVDVGAALAKLAAVETAEKTVEKSGGGMGSTISGALSAVGDWAQNAQGHIAAFDNVIRGAATFAIASFLQPLITVAGAAAGALVALGSAAIYAGGAIAGGLAAGIAQALPVIGVMALAVYRLTAIFQAANQAQLVQQQQSYKGAQQHQSAAKAANTYANSLDSIKSAEEQLATAHRNVGVAEDALNKARKDAVRNLQDMILAEKEAENQAKASSLAQRDAQAALANAISTGGDVQQAQLGVQQANTGAARAAIQNTRAHQDLATAQAQGIGGAPGVTAAKRQLDDAKRSVVDAERALDRAKRGADQAGAAADLAGNKILASAGKLDFLLGRMSGAERRVFGIVQRFQDVFRKAAENITEPIINATGTVLNRLIQMFQDPRILGAMRGLAGEMAKQGLRLFSAFTDKKSIDTFLKFIGEAQKNLGPLTDILINVGKIFLDIAKAAGPTLSTLLGWFDQLTGKWEKFTSSTKGQNTLKQFFSVGTDALLAFMQLAGSIIKLFLAIAGPGGGAKAGIDMLKGAADGIGKLADNINKGGKAAQFFHQFFKTTGDVIKILAPLFVSIGRELGKTFGPQGTKSVAGFVAFFAQIVIPAFGGFIRTVGRVTAAFGDFLKHHKGLTEFVKTVLGLGLAIGLAWKAAGIFMGPIGLLFKIGGALVPIFSSLIGAFGEFAALAGLAGVSVGELAGALALAAASVLWPFVLAAAIVALLAKLGLLTPIINAIKNGFKTIVSIAGPPLKDLIHQVGELFKAFSAGKGAFAIIKPILDIFVNQILVRYIGILAHIIGYVLGGAFKIIAGAIEVVTGLLTGKWGKAWEGVKKMLGGLAEIALAGIRGFLSAFGNLPQKVLHFFIGVIDAILKFFGISSPSKKFYEIGLDILKGLFQGLGGLELKLLNWAINGFKSVLDYLWNKLPGKVADAAGSVVTALIGAFKDVGGDILDAIFTGATKAFDFASRLSKSLAKLIDQAIPNSIHMPDPLPNIDLPNNPLKDLGFYAEGGQVGKGFGGGDRIPAMLEEGEHVFTKSEVARAGGHAVMFALRRMLGGGGQGGPGYQDGGAAQIAQQSAEGAKLTINLGDLLKIVLKISADFNHTWNRMWESVTNAAKEGGATLGKTFHDLRVGLSNSIDVLVNHVSKQFYWMRDAADNAAKQLVDRVGTSVKNLKNSVYDGMKYVGDSTNEALKAFNAKAININVQAPGKASGGWIGNAGERGRDAIITALGRGEAVLNWGHQRIVEPALQAVYGFGLGEMFNRTSGFHAGGPSLGYAGGGFTGPAGSGAAFTPIANFALSKFGLQMTAGRTNHSYLTSTGNVSDHSSGLAGDFSNGVNTPQENAFNAFWKDKLPQVVKQLIWQGKDQFRGWPIEDHWNHVHLAVLQQYAFNAQKMAALLSRAARGLNISDLLTGAVGDMAVSHVDMPKVSGDQPFMGMVKNMLKKVISAANAYIDEKAAALISLGSMTTVVPQDVGGPVSHQIAAAGGALGFNKIAVAGLIGNAFAESNLQPGILGGGAAGLFQSTPPSKLEAFAAEQQKPWQSVAVQVAWLADTIGRSGIAAMNAQSTPEAAALWLMNNFERPGIPRASVRTSAAAAAFAQGLAKGGWVGSYDVGGEIPGGPGQPVPILAHAHEWVVNPGQQSKLARWLGTSRDRLKGALGFTGGPTSFAGGGDIQGVPVPTGLNILSGIPGAALGALTSVFQLGPITTLAARIGKQLQISLGNFKKNLGKFLSGIDELTNTSDGLFAKMSAAIEQHSTDMATNLQLATEGWRRLRSGLIVSRQRGPMGEVDAAQREVDIQSTTLRALNGEARRAVNDLRRVNEAIRKIRQGGVTKKEEADYERLLGQRSALQQTISDTDGKIAQTRADRFAAIQDLFQKQLTRALRPSSLQANLAAFNSRIATALGDTAGVASASDMQIKALQSQQSALQDAYNKAAGKAKRDPRWQSVADDLLKQLQDAQASIVEAQAQALQNQIDAVNNQAGRRQAAVDISNRLADVAERMGNPVGAARSRLANLQTTGGILADQRAGLAGLLSTAQAQGNQAAMESLTDQIKELDTQIVENTAAISDQTVAVRQATIDQIQNRAQFQTGVQGGLGQLLQTLATNLGIDTSGAQAGILQQTGATLRQTGAGLAGQLSDLTGGQVNLVGLSGMDFVNAVSKLNFDALESTMTAAQKTQFESLIQALIDNQNATESNTQQLNDLTGTIGQPQGFSSSAWSWYRQAIFTGAGNLLPQYQIPSMQSGGYVSKAGVFNLHAGEFVVNPSRPGQTVNGGDIHMTVHEAGPETDYTYLANRIAFATRTPGT